MEDVSEDQLSAKRRETGTRNDIEELRKYFETGRSADIASI